MTSQHYFIGLMSGTSLDAIDAVVVQLSPEHPTPSLITTHSAPMAPELRDALRALPSHPNALLALGTLDTTLGKHCAQAARTVLKKSGLKATDITAIGSHGQTVYHQPNGPTPFTLQIGDPNIIAHKTGITTVADFRRKDLAAGGQGAPLAPLFHAHYLRNPTINRVVLNIGGIANLTFLPADTTLPVTGFDTGPGNTLIDAWIQRHKKASYDQDGTWAASGTVDEALIATLMQDPYFTQTPPKSTGTEYFNLAWLREKRTRHTATQPTPKDVQATLTAFTATHIAQALSQYTHHPHEILVCGGGLYNTTLMHHLKTTLSPRGHSLHSTQQYGLPPQWVEATAFAWLAQQTLRGCPLPLPHITGARRPLVIGGIYQA